MTQEPLEARCDVVPVERRFGLQWYVCDACGRTFTEATPTISPAICLRPKESA